MDDLDYLMEEFDQKLRGLKADYIGFFDETAKTKLEGTFRDQVQRDVNTLYVVAQKAVRACAEGDDAQTILFGLEEVDMLLNNANLSRNNVSHNHEWIHESLSQVLPTTALSFLHLDND